MDRVSHQDSRTQQFLLAHGFDSPHNFRTKRGSWSFTAHIILQFDDSFKTATKWSYIAAIACCSNSERIMLKPE